MAVIGSTPDGGGGPAALEGRQPPVLAIGPAPRLAFSIVRLRAHLADENGGVDRPAVGVTIHLADLLSVLPPGSEAERVATHDRGAAVRALRLNDAVERAKLQSTMFHPGWGRPGLGVSAVVSSRGEVTNLVVGWDHVWCDRLFEVGKVSADTGAESAYDSPDAELRGVWSLLARLQGVFWAEGLVAGLDKQPPADMLTNEALSTVVEGVGILASRLLTEYCIRAGIPVICAQTLDFGQETRLGLAVAQRFSVGPMPAEGTGQAFADFAQATTVALVNLGQLSAAVDGRPPPRSLESLRLIAAVATCTRMRLLLPTSFGDYRPAWPLDPREGVHVEKLDPQILAALAAVLADAGIRDPEVERLLGAGVRAGLVPDPQLYALTVVPTLAGIWSEPWRGVQALVAEAVGAKPEVVMRLLELVSEVRGSRPLRFTSLILASTGPPLLPSQLVVVSASIRADGVEVVSPPQLGPADSRAALELAATRTLFYTLSGMDPVLDSATLAALAAFEEITQTYRADTAMVSDALTIMRARLPLDEAVRIDLMEAVAGWDLPTLREIDGSSLNLPHGLLLRAVHVAALAAALHVPNPLDGHGGVAL